jgi:hypothetical protein
MTYSLSTINNKSVVLNGLELKPLQKYKELNHLDIMLLEDYLKKYNPMLDKFSLRELVTKLQLNCTVYGTGGKSMGEAQVSDDYIYEKISRHFTETKGHLGGGGASSVLKSSTISNDPRRKYVIYLAVDNRAIAGYTPHKHSRVGYRRKKLHARYTYTNPLNRIHGFTILDDDPCLCKTPLEKYLSIVIICANPFSSKSNIKAVGSYILMFVMILAYEYKFHKIILEVTNDVAHYNRDSSSEEDSSGEEDDDEEEEEEDSSGDEDAEEGEEEDEEEGEEEDSSGEEEDEEEDSSGEEDAEEGEEDDEEEDEEEDSSGEEEEEDDEDDDDEDDDDEDDDDEDDDDEDAEEDEEEDEEEEEDINECCHVAISNNLKCSLDLPEYSSSTAIDKYPYVYRAYELETDHNKADLLELCKCYDISCPKRTSVHNIIKRLLKFEYWNFPDYEDLTKDVGCLSDINIDDYIDKADYDKWKYGGTKYVTGRESTKNLYCNFYEKHGFRENPLLNSHYKCFKKDPLPAMEIITKDVTLEHLLRVYFERKYARQVSSYCGIVPDDNILQ